MRVLGVMLLMLAITALSSCTKSFTLTVESSDPTMGTVVGGGEYVKGATANIVALPNDGYIFDKWDDGNTDNPRELVMDRDITLKAIFNVVSVLGKWKIESLSMTIGGQTYYYTMEQLNAMLGLGGSGEVIFDFKDNGFVYINGKEVPYSQDGYHLTVTDSGESLTMDIVELTSTSMSLQEYNAEQNATMTLNLIKV